MDIQRTLLIGETVYWAAGKKICEGIVRDDQGSNVKILCIKIGDEKVTKKGNINRNNIVTKEKDMDVPRMLLTNKYKKKPTEELMLLMDKGTLPNQEKEVISEILISREMTEEEIPNYTPTPPKVEKEIVPEVKKEISLEEKSEEISKELNKTKKGSLLYIDPKLLLIEEGFNTRNDFGDIDELKKSIIENGVRIPTRGYEEGGKYFLIDGHRRRKACLMAIEEGFDIARIPFIPEKKKSLEERILEIVLSNDGKPLTPLELGETYKKLRDCGYNFTEIANKIGKTIKHVSDMITVAESTKELKDIIITGDVSATTVSEVKNAVKDPEKAEQIIKDKLAEKKKLAEKSGKEIDKKVTKKDLKNIIEKQPDNSKNNTPHKDIDDIKENKDNDPAIKMYPEPKVKELLQKQIDACKAVIPNVLAKKLDDVDLVI
jgi:ParB/RepB/Spo0J family partition protein